MVNLVYDGSWFGLLTVVFESFAHKYEVESISITRAANLFGHHMVVLTDEDKAIRVVKGLKEKFGTSVTRRLLYCYLSEEAGVEMLILHYIQRAYAVQKEPLNNYTNKDVQEVTSISKRVSTEKHRMTAFVRFQLTNDQIYFSKVQPSYNVLPLIIKHFQNRYADQRWLIYDTKRNYGIYYDGKRVDMVQINFVENGSSILSQDEAIYQHLWKAYFKAVNIPARKNHKLQLSQAPLRYWKNLLEMQE